MPSTYIGQTKVSSGVIFHYIGEKDNPREVTTIYFSEDELRRFAKDAELKQQPEIEQAIAELS